MAPISRYRRALYGLTNWALFSAGLINLAVGTWSAINQSVAVAGTPLTAGLVLLFAATIELDAYPDEFLSIFDNVPLADKSIVEASRTKAQTFVAGMRSMRESLS